jgi:hypothetical protein
LFKKIEIWIVYFLLICFLASFIILGALARRQLLYGDKAEESFLKTISKASLFLIEIPANIKAYFSDTTTWPLRVQDRFPDLKGGFSGEPLDFDSFLLLSRYDEDINESLVELVNLKNFKTVHTWNVDIDKIFKKIANNDTLGIWNKLMVNNNNSRFRYTAILDNQDGSLIFHNGSPLIKVDQNSNLVWYKDDIYYHHSIEKDADGNYWVGSSYFPFKIDSKYVGNTFGKYGNNGIRKISKNGEILYDKSIGEIFMENSLDYLLYSVGKERQFISDPIHLNDIQPVIKDSKYWKKGDVFISIRNQSMVMLYRPLTNQIKWIGKGKYFRQHDIDIINDNKISVFNNNWKTFYSGASVDGSNEVIIYDFSKNEYSKFLNEAMIKNSIRTPEEGSAEILPGRGMLVEETEYGRLLFFNPDGSIKWTYLNRSSSGAVSLVTWSRILYKDKDINFSFDLNN